MIKKKLIALLFLGTTVYSATNIIGRKEVGQVIEANDKEKIATIKVNDGKKYYVNYKDISLPKYIKHVNAGMSVKFYVNTIVLR